jgi:hydroxyacylglutathione hydrolase
LYDKRKQNVGGYTMKIKTMALGPIQTNAYIISNDKKECLIVDPGDEGKRINRYVRDNELKPLAILLTHAHFDHIGAVDDVRQAWNIPVYIHEYEEEWLSNPKYNGSAFFGLPSVVVKDADNIMKDETTLTIGDFVLDVFHTPGHSPGSVTYYLKEANAIFSGDVLFYSGIGRTDLRGGSFEILQESIHEKLYVLPEETTVYNGHGPETTIGFEKMNNPYV